MQVSYLGYPATMGADFIDYILVDRFVVDDAEQAVFSEIHRVLRPGGWLQFADIATGTPVPAGALGNVDLWTA